MKHNFNYLKKSYCPRCKRITLTSTKYFHFEEVKRCYCVICGVLKQELISFRKVDVIPIRKQSIRRRRNQKYLLVCVLCILAVVLVALIKI